MEFESDLSGHLLIATLCFLAAAKRGLREIELRYLLANEASLLPEGFKRRNYNTGYGKTKNIIASRVCSRLKLMFDHFSAFGDAFGSMIQPVRWRYIALRLAHHIAECGSEGEHRLIIADGACRRAVERRQVHLFITQHHSNYTFSFSYFSKKSATDGKWWTQQLAKFFDSNLYFLTERKLEELPYHAASAGDDSLVEDSLSDWTFVQQHYRPDYSRELLQLWEKVRGSLFCVCINLPIIRYRAPAIRQQLKRPTLN